MTIPSWAFWVLIAIAIVYMIAFAIQLRYATGKKFRDLRKAPWGIRLVRIVFFPAYVVMCIEEYNMNDLTNPAVKLELSEDLTKCFVFTARGEVYECTDSGTRYLGSNGLATGRLRNSSPTSTCTYMQSGTILTPTAHTGIGPTPLDGRIGRSSDVYVTDAILMPDDQGVIILESDGHTSSFGPSAPRFASITTDPLSGGLHLTWRMRTPEELNLKRPLRQLWKAASGPVPSEKVGLKIMSQ